MNFRRTGSPSLAPCDRPAVREHFPQSGTLSSGCLGLPSMRMTWTAITGVLFRSKQEWKTARRVLTGERASGRVECRPSISSTGLRHSLASRAAAPLSPFLGAAPNFSAFDHWLHGTIAGVVIGCIFYWVLLRG